jgi:hypothetical protein
LKDLPIIADPVIADAIRDRLQHSALTINITGESYRGVKARKLASKKNEREISRSSCSHFSPPPGASRLAPIDHLRGPQVIVRQPIVRFLHVLERRLRTVQFAVNVGEMRVSPRSRFHAWCSDSSRSCTTQILSKNTQRRE